jgi:hypothetical protein
VISASAYRALRSMSSARTLNIRRLRLKHPLEKGITPQLALTQSK